MSHFNIRGLLLVYRRLVFFNYIVDMIKTVQSLLTYWRSHFFSLFSGHKGRHLDFETWNKVQLYCFIVFQKKTKMIIRKLLKFDLKSQSETKLLRFFNFDDNGGWLINDFWVRFFSHRWFPPGPLCSLPHQTTLKQWLERQLGRLLTRVRIPRHQNIFVLSGKKWNQIWWIEWSGIAKKK